MRFWVLDEFDQLDGKTEVVYDLQLLNEEAEHHIGTILVSNRDPVPTVRRGSRREGV